MGIANAHVAATYKLSEGQEQSYDADVWLNLAHPVPTLGGSYAAARIGYTTSHTMSGDRLARERPI